eukprot:scaffold29123_cov84-Isochrysis_galbana.AAC.1
MDPNAEAAPVPACFLSSHSLHVDSEFCVSHALSTPRSRFFRPNPHATKVCYPILRPANLDPPHYSGPQCYSWPTWLLFAHHGTHRAIPGPLSLRMAHAWSRATRRLSRPASPWEGARHFRASAIAPVRLLLCTEAGAHRACA